MAHRDDPRTRYKRERERVERVIGGAPEDTDGPGKLTGDVSERDADAIFEVLDALDPGCPSKVFRAAGNGRETLKSKTLANYAGRLRLAATAADGNLVDQTTESVNQLMDDLATGEAEIGPSDGYTKAAIGQYQSALKAFYRYHDGHDVDPEEIPVFAPEDTSVDDRDMFTEDEVRAMRDAIESARERCLFELLAYTGQRIRAIQTLRIKDIDLDEGVFYLNDEVEGLKGAKGKRPLLGAQEYVRQWLDYHPTGEPEDYLITPKATGGGEPGGMMTQDTIRYHLRKIADKAGIEKDVHPHIFRHYFTTIAKRDYGLDDAYIKHLRGDAPGSNVMETTYRHLSDDDAVEHAEAKIEGREPETDSALTPETCPACDKILESDAKACNRCGTVFTPDARTAQDQIEEHIQDTKDEAETLEEYRAADKIAQALEDDPQLAAQLMEKLDNLTD